MPAVPVPSSVHTGAEPGESRRAVGRAHGRGRGLRKSDKWCLLEYSTSGVSGDLSANPIPAGKSVELAVWLPEQSLCTKTTWTGQKRRERSRSRERTFSTRSTSRPRTRLSSEGAAALH